MQNKVVLITGGSSGIGKSIGTYLKLKGYMVYGTTRDKSKYPDFDAFPLLELDVRHPETISNAVQELISLEGKIDVLVNNAGVGITGAVEETPREAISNAFAVNFQGPLEVAKAVLPQMRKQRQGLIINVTSIAGYMGLPFRGVYSATKGALEIVTEALRMEVKGFGVQVTNLAPGDFATNIAAGRFHAPAETQSPYYKNYSASLKQINDSVNEGGDPIDVAKMVHKIINAKNPKVSYKVGSPSQKRSIWLKNVLPQKVFEKLLLKHFKL